MRLRGVYGKKIPKSRIFFQNFENLKILKILNYNFQSRKQILRLRGVYCYIKRKNSEILSKLKNSESAGGSVCNVYKALHSHTAHTQYTSNRAKNISLGHFSSHMDLLFWPIKLIQIISLFGYFCNTPPPSPSSPGGL